MSSKLIRRTLTVAAMVGVIFASQQDAKTDPVPVNPSLENPSTAEAIKDVAVRGSPIAIWETLEHGERVECLDCISYVEPLLYDNDARVREISAWWLRRRVFGYAEVALRVRDTLQHDPDATRRAKAANALGEFLDGGATDLLVAAIGDGDVNVRVAVLGALKRLNNPAGVPAIVTALGDGDVGVRKVAVDAAMHVGGFTAVDKVAQLLSDSDAVVRAKAADALSVFKVKGTAAGLSALAKTDADENVRIAAVNALGELGDPAGVDAVNFAKGDTSSRVRDAAKVASMKLVGTI